MRVLFAGGGTGGHINPALSIANYIKERDDDFHALFIGTKAGLETKLVPAAGYDIEYIDIQGFNRKKLYKNVAVLAKLAKALSDCRRIISEFKPDVIVCTGGYVSGPVTVAAKKAGIPSIIHEQNVYPGLTVRGSEKYVNYVAVSFEETVKHMKKPEKCIVTGNPIREEILKSDKASARAELGLANEPFVLVFGGSLGAGKINETMIDVLKKADGGFSILFGTGNRNYESVMQRIKEENITLTDKIRVVPYINNMHTVMAAADVVVARAGAITVSEIAALGKPSILIPSPNVVRNHQEQNAREFERAGGAAVITETELTGDVLYKAIADLTADKDALERMSENVKKLARVDALDKIYEVLKKISK
jgi:UDP-N-acetylglucosamine--N-acetylmuramyl-(pentapeptide) pyrophosphoryl-undecaprenol N-acetylglucosamine transferase